ERVYSANLSLQYRLRTGVTPSAGGSVTVAPESADGFYTNTSILRISAQAAPGYNFLGWTAGEGGVTIQTLNRLGQSANPSAFPIDRGTLFYTAVFTQAPATLVTSEPEGQTVTVDGVDLLTPRVFTWAAGSAHTLH